MLLLVFAVLVVALGVVGYRAQKKFRGLHTSQKHTTASTTDELAVVHGKVVRPEELQPSGKLYFIPAGKQAIPVQSLADYYLQKFAIQIKVLPEVALNPSACLPARKQCIAEELILAAKRENRKIADDPDATMIVLTDEDLYPRSLGWKFTYAFYCDYRFGVVSTHRMNPAFWNDPPNDEKRLASTRQMLTDYVAFLYFHIPRSHDPTSVMYQPFTPNGGSDDLYESDLRSEESANGRRGDGYPCLSFTYSRETGQVQPWPQLVNDCYEDVHPRSTRQEAFQVVLANGSFSQRSLDLELDSTPPIAFRRAYLSNYTQPMAFGMGGNHKYNTWLYSDGAAKLSFMDIIHEDGMRTHLQRVSSGVGFSPSVAFEDRDDALDFYGARMSWDSDHFKLALRDGSWFNYLPCDDGRCFWIGYQDADKNALHFVRDTHLALWQLTASDGQGIKFQPDTQARITEARDTKGNRVTYEYNAAGCLERVHYADGQVEEYEYDSRHHMTSISTGSRSAETPRTLLTNDYDAMGRVVRLRLANGNIYKIDYFATVKERVARVRVTDPSGRVLELANDEDGYTVRTTPVRFPALAAPSDQGN